MKRTIIICLLIPLLTGCNAKILPSENKTESQDRLLLSVLWYQKSAEMRALYYQCYKNAADALEKNIASATGDKPYAVVLDIDETVLDNSPFEGWQIMNNADYSDEAWDVWIQRAEAKSLPGAVEFTRFADSLGVAVFYISNRPSNATVTTLENLVKEGFACADSAHLLMMETTSSKVSRRNLVSEKYDIVLLIGDNLGDFDGVFDKRASDLGFADVDSQKDLFGKKYIVLPNPMYGTWLSALLRSVEGRTSHEKLLKQVEAMK